MEDENPNPNHEDNTLIEVINEANCAPILRQRIIQKINDITGCYTICYTAAPVAHPSAFINDWDADIIENLLRSLGGKNKKIDLILYSLGGFAESAERIANSIYSYCDDYRVIIPSQAKSAATMVAMGSSSVLMSDTSEIGSIDPQIASPGIQAPAQSIIKAYDDLMKSVEEKSASGKKYDAELVQISRIDPVLLRECRKYMGLSKDIALKLLNRKMLVANPISANDIESKFLDDSSTFSHGRLIGWEDAKKLGLVVEYIDKFDKLWGLVRELHIRSKIALERYGFAKLIEDKTNSLNPGKLPVGKGQ